MSNAAKKEAVETVEATETADVIEMATPDAEPSNLKEDVRKAVSDFQRCFTNFDNNADRVKELQSQMAELSSEMSHLMDHPEEETDDRDVAIVAAERKRRSQSLKKCAPERTNAVLLEAITALESQIQNVKDKIGA